jgi:hypothetical protein
MEILFWLAVYVLFIGGVAWSGVLDDTQVVVVRGDNNISFQESVLRLQRLCCQERDSRTDFEVGDIVVLKESFQQIQVRVPLQVLYVENASVLCRYEKPALMFNVGWFSCENLEKVVV